MKSLARTIGSRVRAARLALPLKQCELASLMGVTAVYLYLIEKGGKRPSIALLCRLADGLAVSTDYLLGRTNG